MSPTFFVWHNFILRDLESEFLNCSSDNGKWYNLCRNPYVPNPLNEPERTNDAAGAYANACIAVAKECGVSVIDIWTKMQQVPGWEKACLRYSQIYSYVSDIFYISNWFVYSACIMTIY